MNSIFAARGCGNQEQTVFCNAGICSEWARASSGPKALPVIPSASRPQGRTKSTPEQNGERREEEISVELAEQDGSEEENKIKPASWLHFQLAADTQP
ncbi:MAG TPA: hypothetical protein VKA67_13680 [Verrucomicrobiae bacterium]|nr:hypothetical protein [Verrucomicrobiae bacterium]